MLLLLLTRFSVTEQILQLFPIEDPPSRPLRDHTETEQTTVRLKAVQESLVWRDPRPIIEGEESGDLQRAGDLYKRYRTVEELPQRARPFFELAGKSIVGPLESFFLAEID